MPDNPALRIFPDEYVANVQAVPYHAKWEQANKNGDAPKWLAFRDALLTGQTPSIPAMSTKYGKALVAAGKEHMSISHLVGLVENPYPPEPSVEAPVEPPPPPPPGPPPSTTGLQLDSLTDLNAVFRPVWAQPAVFGSQAGTEPGGMHYQSTPYGDGFKFIANTLMPATWDAQNGTNTKVCLAQGSSPTQRAGAPDFWGQINVTEEWSFYMYFPSGQSIPTLTTWHAGELFQWHTGSASGHHLCLNWDGRFRIGRLSSISGYQFTYTPMSVTTMFNRWIPVTWTIRWSTGNDGFIQMSLDGTQYINFNGATDFNDGPRRLQFGWYSDRQHTNEIRFGGIQVVRS